MEKISVIIPTYNRFEYLINAVISVKSQTYQNVEIIVVNDNSDSSEYYDFEWESLGVKIIHLETNTQKLLGYPCAGLVRNTGIFHASGEWIAFCDDDDFWLPHKLELQIENLRLTNCLISCTEALIGKGKYSFDSQYPKYNQEYYLSELMLIFDRSNSNLLVDGFPDIWTNEFIKVHNCIITSSVLLKRKLISQIGYMNHFRNGYEDYDYWLRSLLVSDCLFIKEPCLYYDLGHGYGN